MRLASLLFSGFLIGCAVGTPPALDSGPPMVDAGPMPLDAGDPCAACDELATCDTSGATVTCACPDGYADPEGDGSRCEASSPCTDGTHDCGRNAGCETDTAAPFFVCNCDEGYEGDGRICDDVDECTDDSHDCSTMATCSNTEGGFDCACNSPFVGDGRTCLMSRTVLIYHDGANTLADDAVESLGFTATLTTNASEFDTAYDARGFDMIIWDSSSGTMPSTSEDRLSNWASVGQPLIFAWWDLSSSTRLQGALQVSVGASFDVFRPVHLDPAATTDLFTYSEMVPTPLDGLDRSGDNGDEITALSGGFLAARFDSDTGPGAIAVTRSGQVITHGFVAHDTSMSDTDADGTPDVQELLVNEILYVFR